MTLFVVLESGYCWDRVPEIQDTLLGVFSSQEKAKEGIEGRLRYLDSETRAWLNWEGLSLVGGDGLTYYQIVECQLNTSYP